MSQETETVENIQDVLDQLKGTETEGEPTPEATEPPEGQTEPPTEETPPESSEEADTIDTAVVTEEKVPEKDPVQKRIDKITAKYKEAEEGKTELQRQVEAAEQEIVSLKSQLQQYNPFTGLTNYVDPNGTSIYAMDERGLNQFLTQLENDGRLVDRKKVEDSYFEYQRRLGQVNAAYTQLQAKEADTAQLKEQQAWDRVQTEYLTALPELKPYVGKITDWIADQYKKNPTYAYRNKHMQVHEAIKALGVDKALESEQAKTALVAPVSPDANVSGGKVMQKSKPTYTRDQIKNMKPEEYQRHKAAIKLANKEGRVI